MTRVSEKTSRIQYLDSLRGFAALWVLVLHVAMMPQPNFILPDWVGLYVKQGAMGVELFFVVSAFSLCLSMPGHAKEQRPLIGFALRRFFRIAPLFYLMIAVSAFFNPAGFEYTWKSVLANVFFVFNLIPGHGYQTSVVLAGWTIGVEMMFYVIFPFLYARITNIWLAIGGVLATIIISSMFVSVLPLFVTDVANYNMYSIFNRLPIFMCGLVAFFWLPKLEENENRKSIGITLVLLAVVLFYAIVNQKVAFFDSYHWTGVMFACLVVGIGLNPFGLLVNKWTARLGEISYSVYLLHSPIIVLLFPIYKRMQLMELGFIVTFVAAVALTLIIVIPLSAVIYRFWEKPANDYGRIIANRFARRS
ncbi:acyltransferase family protein [Brucella pseudogrignonensis]|uniref:acyltransferase family protein n=1 Tax=Brucella pseudogrignonensis TaxID=419475 RepID=UPI000CFAFA50|nr:acyltransferase [Brucella pseudogrignonensis]MQP38658.1 acyltransferase family protein [Ochrobactrum sp. MYb237]PQZ43274.1 acyltransferase [Brucella pseudogrignonensis]PRA43021.1 acyltransferase [Brucella pseudogrignonensis]PRA72511.1 acyltransferase [Brucella pseudogrignonensis]